MILATLVIAALQTTGAPVTGDDKTIILGGISTIIAAMGTAFALLWRAYQTQLSERQEDYKQVVTILKAIEAQLTKQSSLMDRLLEKMESITERIENTGFRRPRT